MPEGTSAVMAQLIRDALKADGVTQEEFSRRLGRSYQYVSLVLNGHKTPKPGELDYWAFTLRRKWKVTLEDLST